MYTLLDIVAYLAWLFLWIVVIQAILSWLVAFNVINTYNPFVRQLLYALDRITEPVYRPIRRILPDFGGLDFSPLVVIVLINILLRFIIPSLQQSLIY